VEAFFNMTDKIVLEPIGTIHSELVYRYETPRQGVLAGDTISYIQLEPQMNFEQALKHLDGFDRIWVIYLFHLNENWKPMVTPPRHTRKKVGVFATRSPHRPNKIGMSCVKLEKIEELKVFISESDILDGSPVLDIKPYLPYSDSFPDYATGWVKKDFDEIYEVIFIPKAEAQCTWLKEEANINLFNFARLQLEFNPTDLTRKRISFVEIPGGNDHYFILAYRTWRIFYNIIEDEQKVYIKEIRSGYNADELVSGEDKYKDKSIHKLFRARYLGEQ
jgi:tRNA-Thr(GGU) m(6)t(6)A37 methyltransferase TsaA